MAFIDTYETEEQEAARLAASPVGSKNHTLSKLPVTMREHPLHLLVKLPTQAWADHHVIVFVEEPRSGGMHFNDQNLRQRTISYVCSVVASDHPDYPVGGHKIIVPVTELRRGLKVDLNPVTVEVIKPIIKKNVSVQFPRVILTGDLEHDPAARSLVLHTEEGTEVLSVDAAPESPLPGSDTQIHIKDYSEHDGVAWALAADGLIRIIDTYAVGPFRSQIVIAEFV